MKKIFIVIITIVLGAAVFTSCEGNQAKPQTAPQEQKISSENFLLNTIVSLVLYDTEDETLFNEVYSYMSDLEKNLSAHDSESDLYNIKQNAALKYTEVSDDTIEIIEKSLEYSNLTDGLFDVSSGPLIELWNIGGDNPKVPSEAKIHEAQKLIDYQKIKIDKELKSIMLQDTNMSIDFGAIAKGYIADKVAEKLKEMNINRAIINLGGNVKLLGSKTDGSKFNIGIQDPNGVKGSYMGIISAKDTSIVTSGDYERYFEENGKRYHHILNPHTGYPSDNDLRAVSIVTKSSFEADALSTSTLLLGLDKGYELISNTPETEAVFITKDNKVIVTDKLKEDFELVNDNYQIVEYKLKQ